MEGNKTQDTNEKQLPKEEEFLMDKKIDCPVCFKEFRTKAVRTSKLRRKEADRDLRPRFYYIDPIKYDITFCPHCGYVSMDRYFTNVSSFQRKLIMSEVGAKFKPDQKSENEAPAVYDYDFAIALYNRSFDIIEIKKGRPSEVAYTNLKIAWLYRGKREELLDQGRAEDSEEVKASRREEMAYYEKAYNGFVEAMASEMPPICGMDQNTLDFLLAEMAFYLGKYDVAAKSVSEILVSHSASRHMKDKALDLKQEIVECIKNAKQEA